MSGGVDCLQLREDDVLKMLAATTHLGESNKNYQMQHYIFKQRSDGNLKFFLPHPLDQK